MVKNYKLKIGLKKYFILIHNIYCIKQIAILCPLFAILVTNFKTTSFIARQNTVQAVRNCTYAVVEAQENEFQTLKNFL